MIEDVPNIEFIRPVYFEMIKQLHTKGKNFLLIFDDVSEELSTSKEFSKLATAGKHRNLNCLYKSHELFQKSPNDRCRTSTLPHCTLQIDAMMYTRFRCWETSLAWVADDRLVQGCHISTVWSSDD